MGRIDQRDAQDMPQAAQPFERPAHRAQGQIDIRRQRPNRTEDHHHAGHEKDFDAAGEA